MKTWELEWKKINKKPYVWASLGLAGFSIFIALFFLLIGEGELGAQEKMFSTDWGKLDVLVSAITLFEFTILGAVVNAKTILDEYRGKKVLLLFSYPVERREMFRTKAVLSAGITAAGVLAANLTAMLAAGVISNTFHVMPRSFGSAALLESIFYSCCVAVLAVCIGMIALRIGFYKSSVITVLVAALIIAALITNFFVAGMFTKLYLIILAAVVMGVGYVAYRSLESGIKNMEVV